MRLMECPVLMAKTLQLKGQPPSPREANSMLSLDPHRILVFGGGCISPAFGPQQFNDLYLLHIEEGKWSYIPCTGVPPCPRTGQSAVLLEDGRAIVFGGSSMIEGYMNDLHILDTKNWEWSQPEVTGIPPSPRDKQSACLLGSQLYIFGGFGPSGECGNVKDGEDSSEGEDDGESISFTWFDDLHVLDTRTMTWEKRQVKGVKPTPRAAHAAIIASSNGSGDPCDKMFVFGGRDPNGRQNDLFSLDLKTLEWKKEISDAPAARSFHALVPLTGAQAAVSYGGVGSDGGLFKGLEVLNLTSMGWTSVQKYEGSWPPLRGASSMVALPSSETDGGLRLVIFGGSCSYEDMDPIYFNDAYSIDASPLSRGI